MDIVTDDWIYLWSGGYTHLGFFAVAIFFALSGFLVTPGLVKNGDVIEYLSRRVMRIMPLLILVVLVTAFGVGPLLTNRAIGAYFADPQTWLYLKNITTLLSLGLPGVADYDGGTSINDPLWSLHFEWLCYFVMAAASALGALRNRLAFLVLWLASIVLVGFISSGDAASLGQSRLETLLLLFGFFGAGALLHLYAGYVPTSPFLFVAAGGGLIAALAFPITHSLVAPLTAYCIVAAGLVRFPWGGLLARADLSYGLYLMHSVVMAAVMHFAGIESWWQLFIVVWLITALCAYASWTMLEAPMLRRKSMPAQIFRALLGRGRKLLA